MLDWIIKGLVGLIGTLGAYTWTRFNLRFERVDARLDRSTDEKREIADRVLKLETIIDEKKQTIEQVRAQQIADGVRLASTEVAIAAIKDEQRKAEERHAEISSKLDAIPRLTSAIEHFTAAVQTIVPRAEHEARWEATDQRLTSLELAIRAR